VHTVRTPLEGFYGSLDDEQKARFAVLASSPGEANTARQWFDGCSTPSRGFTAASIDRIARRLNLSEPQFAALEDFFAASEQAARKIRDSCPRQVPLTPTGRLAAIEERLTALLGAFALMRPPLDAFYGSLSDAQREQFERVGSRGTGGIGGSS
jgi:LTXXQ motif family protein